MRLEQVRTDFDWAVGLDVGQAPHPELPKPLEHSSPRFWACPKPPHVGLTTPEPSSYSG
jgi:hypothetical protein